jgi:hypothetical protein
MKHLGTNLTIIVFVFPWIEVYGLSYGEFHPLTEVHCEHFLVSLCPSRIQSMA